MAINLMTGHVSSAIDHAYFKGSCLLKVFGFCALCLRRQCMHACAGVVACRVCLAVMLCV